MAGEGEGEGNGDLACKSRRLTISHICNDIVALRDGWCRVARRGVAQYTTIVALRDNDIVIAIMHVATSSDIPRLAVMARGMLVRCSSFPAFGGGHSGEGRSMSATVDAPTVEQVTVDVAAVTYAAIVVGLRDLACLASDSAEARNVGMAKAGDAAAWLCGSVGDDGKWHKGRVNCAALLPVDLAQHSLLSGGLDVAIAVATVVAKASDAGMKVSASRVEAAFALRAERDIANAHGHYRAWSDARGTLARQNVLRKALALAEIPKAKKSTVATLADAQDAFNGLTTADRAAFAQWIPAGLDATTLVVMSDSIKATLAQRKALSAAGPSIMAGISVLKSA